MPAFAAITINDGKATPVSHTFNPQSEEPANVWNHVDSSPSSAIGFNWLKLSLSQPTSPVQGESSLNRVYRAKMSLALPLLETLGTSDSGLTPPPTLAAVMRANVEYIIPERVALADRKDLNALAKNALAASVWTSMAEQLQAIY